MLLPDVVPFGFGGVSGYGYGEQQGWTGLQTPFWTRTRILNNFKVIPL